MRQTLYIFVGYPGAGKTTAAKLIHKKTDAVHIWADHQRHKMFHPVTHSQPETKELYQKLNKLVDHYLAKGKSVIYDTNFNFYKDRQLMRTLAKKYNADFKLIWIITASDLSRHRATTELTSQHTRIWGKMKEEDFNRLSDHLQPPTADEQPIKINGTHLTDQSLEAIYR